MPDAPEVVDDLTRAFPLATCGGAWAMVSDRVMGGVSDGRLRVEEVAGRRALRLTGTVRLDNNGGFLQMALDLAAEGEAARDGSAGGGAAGGAAGGGCVDASGWTGLELEAFGPPEDYGLHLRTTDATRPWQSWRAGFRTAEAWRTIRLPFSAFATHRIDAPFDPRRLRRLGLVAIGRAFHADLSVAGVRFFL